MRKIFKEIRQILDKQIVSGMKCKFLSLFVVAALSALLCPPLASAVSILGPDLASFAVLGATGVTNVPTSTIGGNLGSASNPSIGGGYVFSSGSMQGNTLLAQNAQLQLDAAILAVNGMGPAITIGSDLTGTILPGVYAVPAASTNLSGDLILDGGGSNSALWAFLFPSTLITSTTSNVIVTNVGDGANVGIYWSVGSAATLNGPTFAGNVLARDLISSNGDLTACGRLLSATGQVTLIHDQISITSCSESGGFDQGVEIGSGNTGGVTTVPPVPEPSTMLLLGAGLIGFVAFRKRFNKA